MPIIRRDLELIYRKRTPSAEGHVKLVALRAKARELDTLIAELCPESRERSIAFTKLEECFLWASASVERYTEESRGE